MARGRGWETWQNWAVWTEQLGRRGLLGVQLVGEHVLSECVGGVCELVRDVCVGVLDNRILYIT